MIKLKYLYYVVSPVLKVKVNSMSALTIEWESRDKKQ